MFSQLVCKDNKEIKDLVRKRKKDNTDTLSALVESLTNSTSSAAAQLMHCHGVAAHIRSQCSYSLLCPSQLFAGPGGLAVCSTSRSTSSNALQIVY